MLHRSLRVAVGLAAFLVLSGCVVRTHGHGRHVTRVYNIQQRPHPHTHAGGMMHSHVNGNLPHDHEKDRFRPRITLNPPANTADEHEDHGRGEGHKKGRGKGHEKGKGKGHDKD